MEYPLVMTNSLPWYKWPIEIDGLPIKMVDLSMAMLVITRWYHFRRLRLAKLKRNKTRISYYIIIHIQCPKVSQILKSEGWGR